MFNPLIGSKILSAKAMPPGEQWAMLKLHGTGSDFTVRDAFGTLPTKTVQGTTTNIWNDPANGLLWGGTNHIEYSANEAAILNLDEFTGRLLVALDLMPITNGTPSTAEYMFSFGRVTATGASSGNGCLHMVYTTTRVPQLRYRERAEADGGLSDQSFSGSAYGGDGTNPVRTHLAWVMDFSPADPKVTRYVNGAPIATTTLSLNGVGRFRPNSSYDKLVIGGRHDGSTEGTNPTDAKLGSATPNATGIRTNNLTFVRSDSMTAERGAQIARALHRYKGERV